MSQSLDENFNISADNKLTFQLNSETYDLFINADNEETEWGIFCTVFDSNFFSHLDSDKNKLLVDFLFLSYQ